MLSKDDIQELLDQMLKIEMKMHDVYANLAKKIKDKDIKASFAEISEEESSHANLVKDLMKLLAKASF